MCLMELTFYTKYHGLKVQPTQKYQNHTETMSSASMGKPLQSLMVMIWPLQKISKDKRGPLVTFTPKMCLTSTKELFLSIKQNKQKFISVLGAELAQYNCQTYHDTADADLLIAMKTLTLFSLVKIQISFTMPNVSIRKYFSCLNLRKVPRCVYGTSKNSKRNQEHFQRRQLVNKGAFHEQADTATDRVILSSSSLVHYS